MNIVFDPRFLAKSYTPSKLTDIAQYRLKIIEKYFELKKEEISFDKILEILEVKKSTLYRWIKLFKDNKFNKIGLGLNNKSTRPKHLRVSKKISFSLIQEVYNIRKEFPTFGKSKIAHILNERLKESSKQKLIYDIEGNVINYVSESTIGRILKDLVNTKRVLPVSYFRNKNINYRKTIRKRYALKWKFNRPNTMGELIQIDHMIVTIGSRLHIKEFRAVDPTTRITYSKLCTKATSRCAKEFLNELKDKFPFKIKSIQTDGGSEFMGEFEKYCKDNDIPFFVLPPRSPRYNGKVERTNGIYRYEFYNVYEMPDNIPELRKMHDEYEYFYNHIRPHRALNNLTPMEYYDKIKSEHEVA